MENEKQESILKHWPRHVVTVLAASLVLIACILKISAFHKENWLYDSGSIAFYLLMFFLFVFRYATKEATTKPLHWVFALSGTVLPLFLQKQTHKLVYMTWISIPIELVGMVLSLIAIYTLGRSFGVIAAKREIKTHGVYQVIRHPLYAGEALWFFSIVLQNLSLFNILLFAVQILCQVKRLKDEEALLAQDETYTQYIKEVPWRLIPGIF